MQARVVILSLTFAALIALWFDRNPPPVMVKVDYCVISFPAAVKDPETGEWITGWARGYGLCSELDRYENV